MPTRVWRGAWAFRAGSLCVVLVGLGITKVDQNPIAHVLRYAFQSYPRRTTLRPVAALSAVQRHPVEILTSGLSAYRSTGATLHIPFFFACLARSLLSLAIRRCMALD